MNKKILLIDADSKIPNIALMKLSTYFKNKGNKVFLIKLNIPYFPNRKKESCFIKDDWDEKYCSTVFNKNYKYIDGNNIIFGGTGYSIKKKLPAEIEKIKELDYSLYPENNISYGFLSRGCIRKCSFCCVPEKEGYIKQVNTIKDIIKHKKVKFLDNNFLALPNHKELLKELINIGVKCQFNQGLDIRLLDKKNSELLSKLNYIKEYIFAFDDWSYVKIIKEKLELLRWRKDWKLKFFVYCSPKMNIRNIINRINFLKDNKCLPYLMRDKLCWYDENKDFYIDLAAYCNQPNLFKKMDFKDFLMNRHVNNNNRIQRSSFLFYL
jgi:hypothetical protein